MTNANDLAYPRMNTDRGLTKRELFAAMAMQGILSGLGWDYSESVAKDAAILADKLITALNEKQDGE